MERTHCAAVGPGYSAMAGGSLGKRTFIVLLVFCTGIFSFPYQTGWPQVIEGGVDFSSPVLVDVNGDDTLDILIAGNTRWVYLFNHRGELFPGWPVGTTDNPGGAQETSSPSVADMDHDGVMEIVYASNAGRLFAWEFDTTILSGFPVELNDPVIRSCTAIEDVDGDDTFDICIGTGVSQFRFFVFRYDGSLLFYNDVEYRVHSTAAVGDMDKDGSMEIVHGIDRNTQYGVYAWDSAGSPCTGWPQETYHHVDGSPAMADIDSDSTYEIFVGSIDNRLYGWDYLGQDLPSWPNIVGSGVYEGIISSPAAGDINNDGMIEIVVGQGIIQSTYGAVWAFRSTGDTLPGFPVSIPTGAVTSSPVLADLDGDSEVEIVVGCQDGRLYAFNPDGSTVTGFPLTVCSSITSSPAVGDVDLDGDIEVAVGGRSGANDSLYVWDLPVPYHADRAPWPMFHHDPRHTGRLPFSAGTAVLEKTISTRYFDLPTFFTSRDILFVNCDIYDISGRKVTRTDCTPGVYFIHRDDSIIQKIVLIK